jgi:hypothetical protein
VADLFPGEPGPLDVTATARIVQNAPDRWILMVTLENGTGAEGGEVELHVAGSARSYGLEVCIDEFERWLNSTLGPEYRLGAALAMAAHGAFTVVASAETGPYVVLPPTAAADELAA